MNKNKKAPTKKSDSKQCDKPTKKGTALNKEASERPKRLKRIRDSESEAAISPSENSYESQSKSSSESSSSESGSEEESSISQAKEVAVKNMQFRSKRGQKMKYLINRKKEQEEDEDDFWKNNKYFGEQEELDKDDEEDYVQSSSGQDEFDSDFLSNDKEQEEDDKEAEKNEAEAEAQESRIKKRKGPQLELKKPTKKLKKLEPERENVFKYIHEEYTQEQLLAEAAHTEYFNQISLQRLISLEEEKKVYERKEHTLDPPKIVYKDSNRDGNRQQTITLVGFPPDTNLFDIKQ